MHDLIAAFSVAGRDQMKSAGWRKRTGDIFTYDPGNGYLAWLGLNRATKYHPLRVNPVIGVRYERLERLMSELQGERRYTSCTVSKPIGYSTPSNSFLQLEVATVENSPSR
jgi:hypothetical protein